MKWKLEYKKDNGFAKEIDTYKNVTILGSYCGNSGSGWISPRAQVGEGHWNSPLQL